LSRLFAFLCLVEVRFWVRSRSEEQISDFKDAFLKSAEKRAWGKVKIVYFYPIREQSFQFN
jgi:hypothetical protein